MVPSQVHKRQKVNVPSLASEDFILLTLDDLASDRCQARTLANRPCKQRTNQQYCHHHAQKYRLEKPDCCPVCLDELTEDDIPLSCSHYVHRSCVISWGKDICPVCKQQIKLTPAEQKKIAVPIAEEYSELEVIIPDSILELINHMVMNDLIAGRVFSVLTDDQGLLIVEQSP
jgi:hypothetical protein